METISITRKDSQHTIKREVNTPGRLKFLDLPGEVRNLIYEFALIQSGPIRFRPFGFRKSYRPPHSIPCVLHQAKKQTPLPQEVHNLNALSLVNHRIRSECRTYFYKNNTFAVDPEEHEGVYPANFHNFLRVIKDDGRRSIVSLEIGFIAINVWDVGDFLGFLLELIPRCPQLKDLGLVAHRIPFCSLGHRYSLQLTRALKEVMTLKSLRAIRFEERGHNKNMVFMGNIFTDSQDELKEALTGKGLSASVEVIGSICPCTSSSIVDNPEWPKKVTFSAS